jgi:hypothetical protein
MMDARSRAVLLDLVRRESRSLLQYVSESFPWITAGEEEAKLPEMVKEEREGVAALARFLARNRVAPAPLGSYPMTFTNINYMSLDHLVPLLIENQRHRIAELEHAVACMSDAESRLQAETYLAMKRRHLQRLDEMLQGLGKKASVIQVASAG